jgi:hypothetical protein
MYLGGAKSATRHAPLPEQDRIDVTIDEVQAAPLASARWEHFPISHLSHHGQACCEIARQWIVAMDFAQLDGGDRASGPAGCARSTNGAPRPGRSTGASWSSAR